MNYILYILLKKFKVYYTSIRSARYVFVFLQSKFLKEKSSGFQSEFRIRGFNPVTGSNRSGYPAHLLALNPTVLLTDKGQRKKIKK